MKQSIALLLIVVLTACDGRRSSSHSAKSPTPTKLPDGTLAIDSGQGGSFEITILPINLSASSEPNEHATKTSKIEIEVDGTIRTEVSKTEVIRIRNLSPERHSVIEFVDGTRMSSFYVDGSSHPRMVADYYEIYGNWMIREPIENENAEQDAGGKGG